MTFLQYLCERLMGPPAKQGGSYGESYWPCPQCDGSNWHTKPHHPQYKDGFNCFHCAWWGDQFDIVRHFQPKLDYRKQIEFLEQLRQDYERAQTPAHPATQAVPASQAVTARPTASLSSFSSGESGSKAPTRVYETDPSEDEFSPEAHAAAAELIALAGGDPHQPATREKLLLIEKALEVCGRHRLHPLGLAVRAGFAAWSARIEAKHMAECSDPDCDWGCCMIARGWTPEQLRAEGEADKRRREEERRRNM